MAKILLKRSGRRPNRRDNVLKFRQTVDSQSFSLVRGKKLLPVPVPELTQWNPKLRHPLLQSSSFPSRPARGCRTKAQSPDSTIVEGICEFESLKMVRLVNLQEEIQVLFSKPR